MPYFRRPSQIIDDKVMAYFQYFNDERVVDKTKYNLQILYRDLASSCPCLVATKCLLSKVLVVVAIK